MLPALLAGLGGGLLTLVLDLAGLGVGATPAELVLWGAVGVLFARTFGIGALVLALPLVLAGIELTVGSREAWSPAADGDPLTFAFPGDRRLELTPLVFAAVYATWAARFALRTWVTWPALALVLLVAVLRDGQLVVVTLLGAALLVPNLDRVGGLLHEEPQRH